MKLNKKAIEYFYCNGSKRIPKKKWSLKLLDASLFDLDIDKIYKDNIVSTAGIFDIKLTDDCGFMSKGVIKLTIKANRISYLKSALIEFGDGAKVLVTVGTGCCELNVSMATSYPKNDVCIDHFQLSYPSMS